MLEILYQDPYLVAINKPRDLLVHRSPIARDIQENAIELLRDQLGVMVYPVHRLDRKTSGVLLFALDKEVLKMLNESFAQRKVNKTYLAILRGFAPESQVIDYDLTNDRGITQQAITRFRTLEHRQIDMPFGKHQTSRYSLVQAEPHTGRQHQLRKHFKHIFHPILGSRPHGCNKQNKLWLDTHQLTAMMLHGYQLGFEHPITMQEIEITAGLDPQFLAYNKIIGFDLSGYQTLFVP